MQIPNLKKKFKEEEERKDINIEGKVCCNNLNEISGKISKSFKYSNEEELDSQLDYRRDSTEENANHVHDLRFFNIQTYSSPIFLVNLHNNPTKEFLKLFDEVGCIMINSFTDIKGLDSQEELIKVFEQSVEVASLYRNMNPKNKMHQPKLILYINFEINSNQIFSILSFLTYVSRRDHCVDLIIFTDESILFPLRPGMNTIFLPSNLFTKKGVGLLPVESSVISTKGLQWDVTSWETSFGNVNLSTSNEIVDDECSIFVEKGCVMFTAEIDVNLINLL